MSPSHDLARLLDMGRLTHVVDIGANPIEGAPSYKRLLDAQLCRVTGFEPQASALAELFLRKGANEAYFPHAVGDGKEHTLNLCAYSGWTSTFVPSAAALEVFSFFKNNARIVSQSGLRHGAWTISTRSTTSTCSRSISKAESLPCSCTAGKS
jgi:hypothetical protein